MFTAPQYRPHARQTTRSVLLTTLLLCVLVTLLSACSQSGEPLTNHNLPDAAPVLHAETDAKPAARIKPHGQNDPHLNLGPEMYAMVALGHLQEGRTDEAMQSINRALSTHPESAHLFAVRSQIYASQKRKAEALADLERAIRLEGDNPSLYVNRAAVYSSFDRDDQAMDDLNKAIMLDNKMLAARFNRGSLHFVRENYEAALTDFETCIEIDPHTAAPYFNRAAVLDALGERASAIADIERFLQLTQDDKWKEAAQTLLSQWQAQPASDSEKS